MHRAFRLLFAAAVVLSSLAAAPVSEPEAPTFAGSVELRTDGPGTVDVVVERDLRFPFNRIFDGVTFDGGGDFPVAALYDLETGTAVAVAGPWPSADRASLFTDAWLMWPGPIEFGDSEPELVLPAGRYRFEVEADGPTTIRMELGDTPMLSLEAVPGPVSLHADAADVTTIGTYSSGGSSHTMDGPGALLTASWAEQPGPNGAYETECLYVDVPESDVSYAPGCPSHGSGTSFSFGVGTSGRGSVSLTYQVPAATYHSGFWRAVAATSMAGGFGTVWLPSLTVD